ncbi:hypothetical protein [Chryseobacterium phocaeense]|uniref:hypothetical protein n=1 Tax=Chryseobacterium phocaeense TaxID=1816690 RepID=UPI0009BC62C5|nr:hypothetical protein [Chryseobacterium phocaeense]
MKKIFLFTILFSGIVQSQIGINTKDPSATLDVQITPNRTLAEGIISPKLSGEELKLKNGSYGNDQNGAIVYVTSIPNVPENKTINVTKPGYYYYDSVVEKWISMQGVTGTTAYAASESVKLNGSSFERSELTGDITAMQNSNITSVKALQGTAVSAKKPVSGQKLSYNQACSCWEPYTPLAQDTFLVERIPIVPPNIGDFSNFSNSTYNTYNTRWYLQSKKNRNYISDRQATVVEIEYEFEGTIAQSRNLYDNYKISAITVEKNSSDNSTNTISGITMNYYLNQYNKLVVKLSFTKTGHNHGSPADWTHTHFANIFFIKN